MERLDNITEIFILEEHRIAGDVGGMFGNCSKKI